MFRIAVEGVSCTLAGTRALAGVSLRVAPGEVAALVGPNGAGKTTLLRVLAGLLAPAGGAVWLEGRPGARLGAAERARLVGVVPADGGRDGLQLTVAEAVALGRLAHLPPLARPGEADRRAVARALAATGLEGVAERPLASLSGGEAQRVLLARALAQEPRVLLMDEPTAHLDLGHQAAFLELVRGLARREGLAALAALHDLNLASLYADRLVLLVRGRVAAAGTPEEVLRPELLAEVYRAAVAVVPHPVTGRPQVLLVPGAAPHPGEASPGGAGAGVGAAGGAGAAAGAPEPEGVAAEAGDER